MQPSVLSPVREHLASRIIGQQELIESMLVCLLSDGHMLVEGVPGLAKTTAVKTLSEALEGDFHRIQFTPDLLPSDLIGTDIYRQERGEFEFSPGPLFHNILLADEVNRAPAKVQSALLEAMGERQVTVGRDTYGLPALFLVMATQNPIEQEGTYPLPEAQLDRFLLHVRVDYPKAAAEAAILKLARDRAREALEHAVAPARMLSQQQVFAARSAVLDQHLAPPHEEYIVQLVLATRDPAPYGTEIARYVAYGASPRGTIALDRCARAHAWLAGRDYVTPEDVHAIAPDVLRHRVLLGYEAEAEGIDADRVVAMLLERVPLP